MKIMIFIVITLLILYLLISSVIVANIRKQTIQDLSEISQLYLNEIDNRFFRISRRILLLMMDNSNINSLIYVYVDAINDKENELSFYYSIERLKEEFLQFTWEYGEEYHFFIYSKDSEQYLNLDIGTTVNDPNSNLQEALIQEIIGKGDFTYSIKQKWESLELEEGNYVYKVVQRNGIYLGCYVNVEELIQPFTEINLGKNGYVQLINNEGNLIGRVTGGTRQEDLNVQTSANSDTLIIKEMKRAPFSVQIYVSGERIIIVLMVVLIALAALAVLLISTCGGILLYFRNQVLKPIQKFTNKLLQYEDNDYVYSITENNLLEIEQADEQFRKMIHQLKKLKITLYEQELERQNMEIENLKLQIRPHFYLNCLNFIYSMVDSGRYENAKSMSRITSDYLRYIFHSNNELIMIEEELKQCKNYLDILLLRYEGEFDYYIEQESETQGVYIFPFFIQVFVENAIKYAMSLDEKIMISITVYQEVYQNEDYVNIYIADTGKGFSTEILEKLQNKEVISTPDGHHIGIQNCLKRMELYFGDKGIINFGNSPLGGAFVDIHIPREITKEV